MKRRALFLTSISVFGFLLFLNRYLVFNTKDFVGRVYLEHLFAGFLAPIWLSIIVLGFWDFLGEKLNPKLSKKLFLRALKYTFYLAIFWEFVFPLFYLNISSFSEFILSARVHYFYPEWNFLQFVFDVAGIYLARKLF